MAESGIYEIINLVNGKRYVGSAVNVAVRWRQHRRLLNRGEHYSPAMQRAWRKYGQDGFDFRIIKHCPLERLLAEEQAELDRRWPEYNNCPTAGSSLGRVLSPKTRAKIAASKAGLKLPPRSGEHRQALSARWKGKAKSPEHMEALQAGRRRQVRTPEQRAAVGESLKRAYAEGRKSRDRSPEYRAKIAATLRERAKSTEFRERLRQQATDAWAGRSPEDRDLQMAKVRAARSK